MIRPFTCLCLAAAFGSGMYLYSEKHRTALLDRQISSIVHQTEAARERTGLLRAEWALLNEPGRLQDMATKYLSLKPMAPTQFVALGDLASRLPEAAAPGVAAADESTDDDGDAAAAPASSGSGKEGPVAVMAADGGVASPAPGAPHGKADARLAGAKPGDGKAGMKSAGARAAPSDAADARLTAQSDDARGDDEDGHDQLADAKAGDAKLGDAKLGDAKMGDEKPGEVKAADAKSASRVLARADLKARLSHHASAAGIGRDSMLARGTPLPLAAPQPVHAQVYSALARPMASSLRPPAVVSATPRYASPYVGSALSSGGALPPPTPYTGDR